MNGPIPLGATNFVQMYNYVGQKGQEAADAISAAGDKVAAGASWVGDKVNQAREWAGSKVADAVLAEQKAAQDNLKYFVDHAPMMSCPPCFLARITKRPFARFQGMQIRVCTDPNDPTKQTAQVVTRNDDGSYKVVGDVWSHTGPDGKQTFAGNTNPDIFFFSTRPVDQQVDVPMPSVTHVNGIDVTPAGGLGSAQKLQQAIAGTPGCAGDVTSNEKGTAATGGGTPCANCGCVLYTYSEDLGTIGDLVQCVGAKGGWTGRVTATEVQMMRDAIANGSVITMSAHSRGSILTEDAWQIVFDGLRTDYMNSPAGRDAADKIRAQFAAQYGDTDDGGMWELWAQNAINDDAGRHAGNTLNDHVMVVSSGNAVSFYNPYENGYRVVSSSNGWSVDPVNVFTGSTHTGNMQTLYNEVPPNPTNVPLLPLLLVPGGVAHVTLPVNPLDAGSFHTFDISYVSRVAATACAQAAALRNAKKKGGT